MLQKYWDQVTSKSKTSPIYRNLRDVQNRQKFSLTANILRNNTYATMALSSGQQVRDVTNNEHTSSRNRVLASGF